MFSLILAALVLIVAAALVVAYVGRPDYWQTAERRVRTVATRGDDSDVI